MKAKIKKFCLFILIIYLCVLGALYFVQRHLIFFPDGNVTNVSAYEGVSELEIITDDGHPSKSWYRPAINNQPTFVFFHGNASNHVGNVYKAKPYVDAGYGYLSVGYRGYNGSIGNPSEEGLYDDARSWIKALQNRNVTEENIILYGESVGTGVAVQMATEFKDVRALILESPYTKLPDVAAKAYFFIPVHFLMKDKFDNISKIGDVSAPLLIIQGLKDKVIDPEFGQEVYDRANDPKVIFQLDGYGHNNMPNLLKAPAVLSFLKDLS